MLLAVVPLVVVLLAVVPLVVVPPMVTVMRRWRCWRWW
jgi:hypothetical protein